MEWSPIEEFFVAWPVPHIKIKTKKTDDDWGRRGEHKATYSFQWGLWLQSESRDTIQKTNFEEFLSLKVKI